MITQPRIVCPKCQGKRSIYLGCGENVPCVECNSTGEKHLDPAVMLRLKATARKHRFPLVVYGPMGCGKTTNANRIAEVLGATTVIDDWDGKSSLYRPGAATLALTHVPPPYGGRYDFITFEEAMKEVKKATSPTLTMGRVAAARARADIAGRIMAALMQAHYAPVGNVTLSGVAATSVRAADALLAELERTAK